MEKQDVKALLPGITLTLAAAAFCIIMYVQQSHGSVWLIIPQILIFVLAAISGGMTVESIARHRGYEAKKEERAELAESTCIANDATPLSEESAVEGEMLLMLLQNQRLSKNEQQIIKKYFSGCCRYTVIIISDCISRSGDISDHAESDAAASAKAIKSELSRLIDQCIICMVPTPEGFTLLLAQGCADVSIAENSSLIEDMIRDCISQWADKVDVMIGPTETEIPYIYYSYSKACGLLSRTAYQAEHPNIMVLDDEELDRSIAYQHLATLNRKFYILAVSGDILGAMNMISEIVEVENNDLAYVLDVTIVSVKEKINSILEIIGFQTDHNFGMGSDFWKSSIKMISHVESVEQLQQAIEDITQSFKLNFTPIEDNKSEHNISEYTSYIKEHCTDPTLNAQSVCECFDQAPSALSKLFKMQLGVGVLEYIHRCRIEIAKELLATEENIGDIPERCGFYSRRALDTVFKRYTGVSPATYKKSISEALQS